MSLSMHLSSFTKGVVCISGGTASVAVVLGAS